MDTIHMSSLPPTFKQAVQITRSLNIRYLWIDSLCIIQDSREDWEKESMTMGEVYGRSYLTIAARAARNARDGCFIARAVSGTSICQLEYSSKSEPTIPRGKIYIIDPSFLIEQANHSPLDTRGWVLQEKVLSPRIIHYGAQQVYWECRQSTYRQDAKYTPPLTNRLKQAIDIHTPFKLAFRGIKGSREFVYPPEWSERELELAVRMAQWYTLVGEYSQRKLTYTSDKLPALAGLARTFASATGYQYLAGLWKEDLLLGLLWYRRKRLLSGWPDEPVSDKLPSWSWARFMGPLTLYGSHQGLLIVLKPCCEVLEVSSPGSGNTLLGAYGEVSSVKITMKARILEVTPREITEGALDLLPMATLHDRDGKEVGNLQYDQQLHHAEPPAKELFCMVIQGAVDEPPLGLAVLPVLGQHTTYTRVGFVWFRNMPPKHYGGSDLIWKAEPTVVHLV
ncbi:heterokaryon incompatibility protein-domain-containing protein [Sordaria brevicollis]|uniref:Heterokaryon incompatibility protein-domain-containing protein n=1 Tax=Sordaria brevicollis TaxID=83679 RepID=A0AAE0PP33_SORBR|nr:heterokaryon incompatibility protein-domain-containing protein [Sordaria brevicollis]